MQQILGRRPSRGKSNAYASMIRDLLKEIDSLATENESLKKELLEAKSKNIDSSQLIRALTKERDDVKKSQQELLSNLSNEKITMAIELANKQSEINKLRHENMNLNDQINSMKREKVNDKSTQHEEISSLKKEINTLKLKIQKYEQEKQIMLSQKQQKDKFHRLQVEELRKINRIIKDNFQIMEEDYNSLIKITQQKPITTRKNQREVSKPKKQVTLKKVRRISSSNPQMEEQLWRIKHQVQQQMTRFSTSREQVVKGRVDRTLATIQSLLSQMSQRVDVSDAESNLD